MTTANGCGLRYEPLNRNRKTIRLLEVFPATKEEPLQCKVSVVDLDDNPSYIALSYTWGDENMSERMQCGDQVIKLRPNLYKFLRQYAAALKDPLHALFGLSKPRSGRNETSRMLWVDALCINQDDNTEKSYQVPLMKDIYTQTDLVIAWLGEPTSTDEEDFLTEMPSDVLKQYPKGGKMDRARFAFLSRGYWSRMWIVQEYLLSDRLAIMCGPHLVDPNELYFAKKQWEYVDEPTKPAVELLNYRHERESGPMDGSLSSTLYFFRRSKCQEPVDLLYALLGLAPELTSGPHPIIPDYDKPPIEVMIDVIRNQYGTRKDMIVAAPVRLALIRTALQVQMLELTKYFLNSSPLGCRDNNLFALVNAMRLVTPLLCIGTVSQTSDSSEHALHESRAHLKHFEGLWTSTTEVDEDSGQHPELSLVTPDTIRHCITNLIDSTNTNSNDSFSTSPADKDPAEALSRSIALAASRCNLLTKTPINHSTCKQIIGTNGLRGIVRHNTMINSSDQIVVHTSQPHAQYALVLRQVHQHEWVLVGHAYIWREERVDTPIMDNSNTYRNMRDVSLGTISVCCHDINDGLQTLMLFSGLKILDQNQLTAILDAEIEEPVGSRHNCKAEKVLCDRIWLDKPLGDIPLFGW